jgi:CheY-like chemotaxis protein
MVDRTYTILVAEDDDFQRVTLTNLLVSCNYKVIGAENGQLAMELLNNKQNSIDLILLDL